MSRCILLTALLVLWTACALPPPDPPSVPEPAPLPNSTPPAVAVTPPEVAPAVLSAPAPGGPLESPAPVEPAPPEGSRRKRPRPHRDPAPQQLIQDAQQAARIAPTKRGYFGNSGVQRYLWTPGKIYDVYLASGTGTKLTLPPGEILAHALILNPKSFDVSTATVGQDLAASSIVLIRPCGRTEEHCAVSPPVDVAVTSTTGRGYNLHLMIGTVGMVEVTWELTPIPHLEGAEPHGLPGPHP